MTSPSPGQIARFLHNEYYPTDEEYIYALAGVMKRQYDAIVEAGFLLQLDCPDLALGRHQIFSHLTLEEFRQVAEMHVAALNYAVADIPADRMRMHICWGSTLGPHHTDVPIADVIDIVLKAKPCAVAFPGANPRHEHEWKVWRDVHQAARRQDNHPRRHRFHIQLRGTPRNRLRPPGALRRGCRQGEPDCRRGLRFRHLRRPLAGGLKNCLDEAGFAGGRGAHGIGATLGVKPFNPCLANTRTGTVMP